MTAQEIIANFVTHYKQGFVTKEIHYLLSRLPEINPNLFYDKLEKANIYMQGKEVVYLTEDVEEALRYSLTEKTQPEG